MTKNIMKVQPMKQVVQNLKSGRVEMLNVPVPQVGRGQVLVATRASLISVGTERMLMDFAGKSMLGKARERPDLARKVIDKMQRDGVFDTLKSVLGRLDEPLPLGYSAAGVVMALGDGTAANFAIGDRVAIAGAGLANHAEVNSVPVNLAVRLPDAVTFNEGCYATLTAIAMHGLRNGGVQLGDRVLVVGLGLVGQLSVQLAAAAGAQVAAIDPNPTRRALAGQGGAALTVDSAETGADGALRTFTAGRGFDVILICAASDSDEVVAQAAGWARDRATVVLVGKVGTRFPYADYMKKELQVRISRSYGPGRYDPAYEQQGLTYPVGFVPWTERENLAEAVRLMATGAVKPHLLTTHRFTFDAAMDAYDAVRNGDCLGVVLNYSETPSVDVSSDGNVETSIRPIDGPLGVGVIGTGQYARGILLPELSKLARLTKVVSRSGLSAATVAKRFGAEAVSGAEAVLNDDGTQAVVIATRHHLHGAQVLAAIEAGKHVWVEKPMALTGDELDRIEGALAQQPVCLMVGYNRRFSRHTQALLGKLAGCHGPRQVIIRVNAGRLADDPAANWQSGEEGGGRLLGEVCHFTDLALALAGSPVTHVLATRGEGQDVYSVTLQHADGGLSSIVYTSEGGSARGKEWIEVHAGGASGVIDNFRSAAWYGSGRKNMLTRTWWWQGQDKGQRNALQAWVLACGGESPADRKSLTVGQNPHADLMVTPTAKELVHSTRIIHAASASIAVGERISIGLND